MDCFSLKKNYFNTALVVMSFSVKSSVDISKTPNANTQKPAAISMQRLLLVSGRINRATVDFCCFLYFFS